MGRGRLTQGGENGGVYLLSRCSSIKVVFCLSDSARAAAPSWPMPLPEAREGEGRRERTSDGEGAIDTGRGERGRLPTIKVQLHQGRVLLERFGEGGGPLVANAIA